MTKIIFLDWHNTLSYSRFWQHWELETNQYNKYFKPLTDALFVENSNLVSDWMRAKYDLNEICELLSEKIDLDSDIIKQELEFSARNMKLCDPQIPSLVSKLRESGSKVYVATDNMDTFRKFTIPAMNLENIFDGFLTSYDLKASKADSFDEDRKSTFFHKFITQNNLSFKDCILLDDCADKIDLYKHWGMETVNINSSEHLVKSLEKLLS